MLPAIWLTMIAATAIIWLSSLSSSVMSAPTFIIASAAATNWTTPTICKPSGISIVCICGFTLGAGKGVASGVVSTTGSTVASGVGCSVGVGSITGANTGVCVCGSGVGSGLGV